MTTFYKGYYQNSIKNRKFKSLVLFYNNRCFIHYIKIMTVFIIFWNIVYVNAFVLCWLLAKRTWNISGILLKHWRSVTFHLFISEDFLIFHSIWRDLWSFSSRILVPSHKATSYTLSGFWEGQHGSWHFLPEDCKLAL